MILSLHIPYASTSTSVLQQHSSLIKNHRFTNNTPYRYPVCSKSTNNGTNFGHLTAQCLTAQHLFNPYIAAEFYIFRSDEKRRQLILF